MKKLFLILSSMLILVWGCGPTAQEAAEYNNAIVTQQKIVLEKVSDLDNAIGNFDENKMQKTHQQAKLTLEKALEEIKVLEEVSGNEQLKEAAVNYFENLKVLITDLYPKLITLFSMPPENYTDTEKQTADSLQQIINMKHNESRDLFLKAQAEFAKKHNIELE
jgi:hypothetical protein